MTGVLATTNRPSATARQVPGAAASSSSRRQRGDRIAERAATWTIAKAIPAQNQRAYVGSQVRCTDVLSTPAAIPANQAALTTNPLPATTAKARPGRHRRPMAAITTSGSNK